MLILKKLKGGESMNLTLEITTPSQLARERERREQRAEIARRMARPIKGNGTVHVQPQFDLGQTGQMDLFNPITESEENA